MARPDPTAGNSQTPGTCRREFSVRATQDLRRRSKVFEGELQGALSAHLQ
jgi:hypothetical protein